MQETQEAKRRFLANTSTKIAGIVIGTITGFWMAPYMKNKLGLELYGTIALISSMVAYMGIFTTTISSSVGRFVAIHLNRKETEKSNLYFNSALFSMFSLYLLLLVPIAIVAFYIPRLFNIPEKYETQSTYFFIIVVTSSFLGSLSGVFRVGTFVKHRFDLSNIANICSNILGIIVIVSCFTFLGVSMLYVGVMHLITATFILACSIGFARYLTPSLHVRLKYFKWHAVAKMGEMNLWLLLSRMAVLLYLNTDMVIINLFLGPTECGQYKLITKWPIALVMIGTIFVPLMAPVIYELVAKDKNADVIREVQRFTKYMGLLIALPAGLVCGLAQPLLERWLDQSFSAFCPLIWVLVVSLMTNLPVRHLPSVWTAMNKVRVAGFMILFGGLTNVIISTALVYYTDFGLYGVALGTLISLGLKDIFFSPIYCAIILKCNKLTFYKGLLPGIILMLLVSLPLLAASKIYNLATIPRLAGVGLIASVIYALAVYFFVLGSEDKTLLISLIKKKKT